MSRENVEIVRRLWEAGDIEALFEFYDPDIIWENHFGPIEYHGRFQGYDAVRQFWREWLEPFESYEPQAETFIDAGDNVVVGCRATGRGRASGAEVGNWAFWLVYRIRNGRVVHIETFATQAQALEATGLSEGI